MLLSLITSKDQIPVALQAYEKSRKQRAEIVQQSGTENRRTLHFPDGPEQQARDEQFRAPKTAGSNPDRWSDHETQRFLWGWDAEKAALDTWNGRLYVLCLIGLNADVDADLHKGSHPLNNRL